MSDVVAADMEKAGDVAAASTPPALVKADFGYELGPS